MTGKIILDANVAHDFPANTPEARAIVQWMMKRGTLATGGKNLRELFLVANVRVLILELLRAGRAFATDQEALQKWESRILTMKILSNDPHILALAKVSGARVLYTKDDALIKDFTNKYLISNPKGRCYSNAVKHSHLLQ
jgi:predicted nucleic acid-binding protein